MNGHGKSDGSVLPGKSPNKGSSALRPAEVMEERGPTKKNSLQQNKLRAQIRDELQSALGRVREVAKRDKEVKFTTLWHHVYNPKRLAGAYLGLKRLSAPGVDGQTWGSYGEDLEDNLTDLSARLKRGAYRAKPVRRVYIPKEDGRTRPIGIPTLEDKIVQRSAVEVLQTIYENDFLGFSQGFRPKRGQHDALDALVVGLETKKVNWVLDADIRGFFDAIDHEWLLKFVGHRIADQRVLRHIKKWLNAGVLEDGEWKRQKEGAPQGGTISPLLANIYLHYVFDLWADAWRTERAKGDVIIVRFADDFVVGFERKEEATKFLEDLRARLARFNLEVHPDKTRLIEFGRFAASNRAMRGQGKPDTFDFLGFTHYCSQTFKGHFVVKRKTMRKRMRRSLAKLKIELRCRLHDSVPETGQWLRRVVQGHFNYYGVPHNIRALDRFRFMLGRLWYRSLRRRSQKSVHTSTRHNRLMAKWFPLSSITHPYPRERLYARFKVGAG